jgi:hypothetical protein
MKIEYKSPSIIDRIEEAIEQSKKDNKRIECIRLSAPELFEFCEVSGYAFTKESGYTYKHYKVAYDWGSYR